MNNLYNAINTYKATKEEEELQQDIDIEIDILQEQRREEEEGRRDSDIEFYNIEEEG